MDTNRLEEYDVPMSDEEYEDHKRMARYFYKEKGDMARFCDFPKFWAEATRRKDPLVDAYDMLQSAQRIFDRIIED